MFLIHGGGGVIIIGVIAVGMIPRYGGFERAESIIDFVTSVIVAVTHFRSVIGKIRYLFLVVIRYDTLIHVDESAGNHRVVLGDIIVIPRLDVRVIQRSLMPVII